MSLFCGATVINWLQFMRLSDCFRACYRPPGLLQAIFCALAGAPHRSTEPQIGLRFITYCELELL